MGKHRSGKMGKETTVRECASVGARRTRCVPPCCRTQPSGPRQPGGRSTSPGRARDERRRMAKRPRPCGLASRARPTATSATASLRRTSAPAPRAATAPSRRRCRCRRCLRRFRPSRRSRRSRCRRRAEPRTRSRRRAASPTSTPTSTRRGAATSQSRRRRATTARSSIQSGEHNSSASLPSMGSSPSAVAEAMGRMINDSLAPPAPRPGTAPIARSSSAHGDEHADRDTNRPGPGRAVTRADRARQPRGDAAAARPRLHARSLAHGQRGLRGRRGRGHDLLRRRRADEDPPQRPGRAARTDPRPRRRHRDRRPSSRPSKARVGSASCSASTSSDTTSSRARRSSGRSRLSSSTRSPTSRTSRPRSRTRTTARSICSRAGAAATCRSGARSIPSSRASATGSIVHAFARR